MKSMQDLKSKPLYRFAEVVFVALLFVTFLLGEFLIYNSSHHYIDNYKFTSVVCLDKEGLYDNKFTVKKSNYDISSESLYLSPEEKLGIATKICERAVAGKIVDTEILEDPYLSKNKYFTATKYISDYKLNIKTFIFHSILFLSALLLIVKLIIFAKNYIFLGTINPPLQ